jgi:hypothetical protein
MLECALRKLQVLDSSEGKYETAGSRMDPLDIPQFECLKKIEARQAMKQRLKEVGVPGFALVDDQVVDIQRDGG